MGEGPPAAPSPARTHAAMERAHRLLTAGYVLRTTGSWLLSTDYYYDWLRAAGCWLLSTDYYWLLAATYWATCRQAVM